MALKIVFHCDQLGCTAKHVTVPHGDASIEQLTLTLLASAGWSRTAATTADVPRLFCPAHAWVAEGIADSQALRVREQLARR